MHRQTDRYYTSQTDIEVSQQIRQKIPHLNISATFTDYINIFITKTTIFKNQ